MTGKEFFNKIMNGKDDFLQKFIDLLKKNKFSFCVIGGLGVNAYAEPIVSLDLDVVIVSDKINKLVSLLKKKYKVEDFANSINVSDKKSALRIQIQKDRRYQEFIQRAKVQNMLGYRVPVALIEDIFMGKMWAYRDDTRRASKRQKDLADILRLIEVKNSLRDLLPGELKSRIADLTK